MTIFKNWLLDIIFPRRCLGCDILLEKGVASYICSHCLKTITFKNDFACAFCKSPVKNGKTCPCCVQNHRLDRLLVTTSYENPLVEKALKTMKYRFVRTIALDISNVMTKYLKKHLAKFESESPFAIIPVPLNRKRLNWRGFNQAEIMAQVIGNFFGWPMLTNALRRLHNRKPQADMPDRASRIQNAANLFAISGDRKTRDWTDKTILLIDDISTTGSTLDDCARALKGAGAREVIGFVFARGTTEARKNWKT